VSQIVDEILAANAQYTQDFGEKALLKPTPKKRFAILTCMDTRLIPSRFAGFNEGDAHVIRNAGGRATDDAIRSLVISYKLLGTREWFVIHHTGCGLLSITGEVLGDLLNESLSPAEFTPDGYRNTGNDPGSAEGYYIAWLTFKDEIKCVVDDVTRIRCHPLVPGYITIYGYIYDVKTGRLIEVPAATEVGRAQAPQ